MNTRIWRFLGSKFSILKICITFCSAILLNRFSHSLHLFRASFTGSSGDESDSSRGIPSNLEVPPGLQVIPLNHLHNGGGGGTVDELAQHERLKVSPKQKSFHHHILLIDFIPERVCSSFHSNYRARSSSCCRWPAYSVHHRQIWTFAAVR